MYNIVPIIIIISSLAVIIAIVVRKLPAVIAFNFEQLPEEKQKRVRGELIKNKLERSFEKIGLKKAEKAAIVFLSSFKKLSDSIKAEFLKIEERYHRKNQAIITSQPLELSRSVDELLAEAAVKKIEGKNAEAEKNYIDVIGLDPENLTAYRELADIYLKQGDDNEAREALEHVLKLVVKKGEKRLSGDYVNLGLAYKNLNENIKSLASFKKANRLEPNNPKVLDYLCEMSIIVKDKESAREACQQLIAVNPENQKIYDFKCRIKDLS